MDLKDIIMDIAKEIVMVVVVATTVVNMGMKHRSSMAILKIIHACCLRSN